MKDTNKRERIAAPAPESAENIVPFFARYLEGQEAAAQHAERPVGIGNQTLKYPSDRDEWWDNSDV
jgi:Serine endopeptidase inhibitors